MKNIRFVLYSFLSIFAVHTSSAQGAYAQVSSKQVQTGVPFEYAIVVNTNPSTYTPPSFKDFDVAGGPHQSTSMQWVNGQTTYQFTATWSLIARKEGKFTLGPAVVVAGSQRFETSPVTIEVVKGAVSQQAQDSRNSSTASGDLFIRTGVSKSKCYIGEQITITQKVYCRHQIVAFQKFSQPTYDGFYSQGLESASKGQLAVENVDGVNYYSYELFRTIAIPNKSGRIQLTQIEGDVVIRRPNAAKPKTIFEQFFGGPSYEDVPVPGRSKPVTVEVLPLPESGKPQNFNGAVGQFSYRVQATRTELKANEAFNLKMSVNGQGNLKLLNPPVLDLPESFESYEPKVTEGPSTRTFDYLVIPRSPGEFLLEGLDFSYFNPDQKKYVTLGSGEIRINVAPAAPGSAGAQVYVPQTQVKETENDIRYIKKGDFVLTKTEKEFFNSTTHYLLMGFPLFGLGIALAGRKRYIEKNRDLALVRERRAARLAKKRLEVAEKHLEQNSKDQFYAEVLEALNKYLSDKLNIPVSSMSRENIAKALTARNLDEKLTDKLQSTLSLCEYARYAPGSVSTDLRSVYDETVELISGLEQHLIRKGNA